jgi:calcium-dependent protein kinase
MLEYRPENRISAWEAFIHPWIQNNNISDPLSMDTLTRLSDFQMKNKLKAAIFEFITVQVMSSQEKGNMMKQFSKMDQNGDGMVSKTELYIAYYEIYKDKLKAHKIVNELFHQMDTNQSGKVDFSGNIHTLNVITRVHSSSHQQGQ